MRFAGQAGRPHQSVRMRHALTVLVHRQTLSTQRWVHWELRRSQIAVHDSHSF